MFINLDDITLFYEKTGFGDPLVLLHGNGEDHQIFAHAIEELSQVYTVYAVDSRNHGQSTMTNEFHYETMALDIEQMIEKLNLNHVTLVGFSDGGILCLIIASKQPSWLKKIIAMGANLYPSGVKPNVNFDTRKDYERTGNPYLKMMLEEPMITNKMLHKINVPTLVVAGSDDVIMKGHTKKIANHIKDSELIILDGETHESYVVRGHHLVDIILK
ncbi:MAG: alpha/beta hydrolase [Erysipelothrix sp.]|jgi:pimeloyl-ACP methyl ester carboxylesterase|nr:alpha/beta hydrolase [Erysipelothrix sp.]